MGRDMTGFARKLNGLLLMALGMTTGWFALFGDYWLLMNPKFAWLTAAGAVLIVAFGLSALLTSAVRPTYSSITAFALLALIVILGRPFSKGTDSLLTPIPPNLEKYSPFVGGKFKNVDLIALYNSVREAGQNVPEDLFVTVGLIKRSAHLERQGHVALVRPLVYCCLADAMVIGFRVNFIGKADPPEGWVTVLGRLRKLEAPLPSPNLQVGAARFSLMSKDYVMEPVKIIPHERSLPSIADELSAEKFGLFWKAIEAAGLSKTLGSKGPITLFVPVNEAFDSLPRQVLNDLFKKENKERLRELLINHIAPGKLMKKDLFELDSISTLSNEKLTIKVDNGALFVENARVLFTDTEVGNGVIHVVYPVILPEGRVDAVPVSE